MAIADRARTIVFDLDDTLYAEADYVASGKRAVAEAILALHGIDVRDAIVSVRGDFLGWACAAVNLPLSTKESLLWVYRLHRPAIKLRPGAQSLIARLKTDGAGLAIVTDGRSLTQRLKLRALGLTIPHVYISEEVGASKPAPRAFEAIMRTLPAPSYTYVADNSAKDFHGPRALGWRTIGFRAGESAIHPDATGEGYCEPDRWVADFAELATILLPGDSS